MAFAVRTMLSRTPPYPTIHYMNGTCAVPMLSNSMAYPTLPRQEWHLRRTHASASHHSDLLGLLRIAQQGAG